MSNIKNIFSLLCRSSSIDRDTNLASILEIMEEITITSNLKIKGGGPDKNNMLNFPFELFTLWEREGNLNSGLTSRIKITTVNPSGAEKEQIILPLQFEPTKKRMRIRIKSPGFGFSGYGVYLFRVYLEEEGNFSKVQEIPLELKSEIKI